MAGPSDRRRLEVARSNQKGEASLSALASEPLEVVALVEGPTRTRLELPRLVSTRRPRLGGRSLPEEELLEIWDRALTAADVALTATTVMKVFAPKELRRARHRLHEERRWLTVQVALSKKGGG
jgi:hypothetical protein